MPRERGGMIMVSIMSSTDAVRPLRILIADDHAIVREGLRRVLENTSSEWSVVEASTGFEALEQLRRQSFDLAIFDLSMPGLSGLDLLRRVRGDSQRLPVLILSMHSEDQYALRALRAGANGYLTKDCATRELADAVRKVAAGGAYVSATLAEHMALELNGGRAPARHSSLSDREFEVLRRLVAGHRPGDIAQALHLSAKTVSSHKARILQKLELSTTAALIRYGIEHGLSLDESGAEAPNKRP